MKNVLNFNYVGKGGKKIHIPIESFKKPTNDDEYNKLEALLDELICKTSYLI